MTRHLSGQSYPWGLAILALATCWTATEAAEGAVRPGEYTGNQEASGVDVLSFFVVAILMGVVCLHLLSWTRIPYTALLLVSLAQPSCMASSCPRMYLSTFAR